MPAVKQDATSGDVSTLSGEITLADSLEMLPASDNQVELGSATKRLARIYAAEVHTGDMVMRSDERDAHWRFIEHAHHIEVRNERTGQRFRLHLVPESEPLRARLQRRLSHLMRRWRRP
jgi:hypothetical protein